MLVINMKNLMYVTLLFGCDVRAQASVLVHTREPRARLLE